MSDSWKGRSCLVTGAAGFGGSHLCVQLLQRGARVQGLDRWWPGNSYLQLSGAASRVECLQGDIRDLDLLRLTLERFQIDTVFHLAAQPIVPISNVLPLETFSINSQGTCVVLEACRTVSCVRGLVVASSGAVYGTTTSEHPLSEDDPLGEAGNVYGPSKAAADLAVRCYARVFGLRAAVCRFMNTYGPGDSNFSRIVPRAIRSLIEQAPYDFGDRDDGTTRLDYLYIGDMARAYILVAEKLDAVSGQAINFGSGRPTSTRDLACLISRLHDGRQREPIFRGPVREKPIVKTLDTRRASQRLGWQPVTPLEQGLSETIAWYRRFGERL